MKQELYGVKAPGPGGEGWGTRDTAEMIGAKDASAISQSIKRAEAREAFPELFATCKTASDASKVISKVSEAAIKQQLAEKIATESVDVTLDKLNKSYVLKDFFVGVKDIPDGLFHMIEIDPPYGIDLAKQKIKDGESIHTLENYNEIESQAYPEFLSRLFKECYRVAAPNSWMICWFGPQPWFEIVYQKIREAGFGTTRMCGIWAKMGPGQSMNPTIRLANSYEMFFYAWKGQPALNMSGHTNVFHYNTVPPNQKTHPTERPIELMRELYDTFAFTGSRILIPFLGSGNGLLAASELGMNAIGFELSKGYKDSFLVKAHAMTQKG
jgi:DNA modification methylase